MSDDTLLGPTVPEPSTVADCGAVERSREAVDSPVGQDPRQP